MRRGVLLACAALAAAACDSQPPTWDKLIAAKIAEQYPGYRVSAAPAAGGLVVERPGLASVPVDAAAIGQFCQRGPKDCNYALDKLLLELAPPAH